MMRSAALATLSRSVDGSLCGNEAIAKANTWKGLAAYHVCYYIADSVSIAVNCGEGRWVDMWSRWYASCAWTTPHGCSGWPIGFRLDTPGFSHKFFCQYWR